MTHDDGHGTPIGKDLLHLLAAAELKVAQELRVAHAQQFERLEEIVAKPVVETPLHAFYLLLGHVGEGADEVVAHHLAPVPEDMI